MNYIHVFLFLQVRAFESKSIIVLSIQFSSMIKSVANSCPDQQGASFQFIRNRQVVSIRKSAREQVFQKRRKQKSQEHPVQYESLLHQFQQGNRKKIFDPRFEEQLNEFFQLKFTRDLLPDLAKLLESDNIIERHLGAVGVRKILQSQTPSINEIVHLEIHKQLFNLAALQQYPHLQYQIAWCLVNLTFDDEKLILEFVERGIIDVLFQLLKSKDIETIELVLWGISNISLESAETKQKILRKKGISRIISQIIQRFDDEKAVQIACWGISSFLFGEQISNLELLDEGIQLVLCMVENGCISSAQILRSCIQAVFQYSERVREKYGQQRVISKQFLLAILPILQSKNLYLAKGVFIAIGNFIARYNPAAQILVQLNILERVQRCFYHEANSIRRQACWILSNMAFEPMPILNNRQMLNKLVNMLFEDSIPIKNEIIFIFANLSQNCGQFEYEEFLRENDIIDVAIQLIKVSSDSMIITILKNIYRLLNNARKREKLEIIKIAFYRYDHIYVIEALQQKESDLIYKLSAKIIKHFFDGEDEPQSESI